MKNDLIFDGKNQRKNSSRVYIVHGAVMLKLHTYHNANTPSTKHKQAKAINAHISINIRQFVCLSHQ